MGTGADLNRSIKIKGEALGFNLVGICNAEYSPESHNHLLNWLNRGFQADLGYLERNPRMRSDPRLFFPGAKSIISVGLSYYDEPNYKPDEPYISVYARSRPYQEIIKEKLEILLDYLKMLEPGASGKIAVDTSPTFDRLWANRAGLGWQGKNTLLINRQCGSFIFLGELFTNIEIAADMPEADHCGKCHLCIDACPTGALAEPHILDVSKCISYLTISTDLEPEKSPLIGNNLIGCDLCQLACPFNNGLAKNYMSAAVSDEIEFNQPEKEEIADLTESRFMSRFKGTIIAQKGFNKFRDNARAVQANLRSAKGTN
jgi:epoxyqueuosine reductase